ncbi:UNVERIFIED_CONTAM: hypothetical protein RMT77_014356 [Armadillidium vulgare]
MKNFAKIFGMGFLLVLFLSVVSSVPSAERSPNWKWENCVKRCDKKYNAFTGEPHYSKCLKSCETKYPWGPVYSDKRPEWRD